MYKKSFKFIFLAIISLNIFASSFSGNIYKQIYAYEKEHAKFSKQVCTPGIDFKFYKLLKSYRGEGIYLPIVGHRIDRDAIKKNLYHLKKKISYISSIEKKLKKNKKLYPIKKVTNQIIKTIDDLLLMKRKKINSTQKLAKLEKKFDDLMEKVYYLKSYNYPNDHLANRVKYDSYLEKKDRFNLKEKNKIYFYRKIVEDGAYDKNHKRSDIYVRSTLDTIKKAFELKETFLSENLRYDLEWVLDKIKNPKERSTSKQLARMAEWKKRTKKQLKYYRKILKINLKEEHKVLRTKNLASQELKDFVYKKQAEVFNYWKDKSDILKKLFTLETILFNEVGSIDGKDALERMDVVKIVLNRYKNSKYNQINKNQEIVKHMNNKKWKSDKVLGTLFKRGEFSFTYYYISSVVKVFCPDMTRLGKRLRSQNLKISLKELRSYDTNFSVSRYFSRVSMFGKVDMSKVWSDFKPYPQRRGIIYSNQTKLYIKFKKGKYRFLYEFIDPKGDKYTVIEIAKRKYSVKDIDHKPVFYKYRSPHLFTYFAKK